MTVDIATLAIRVNSLEAQNARRDLEQLRNAGGRAEQSTNSLTSATRGLMSALAFLGITKIAQEFLQAADSMSLMNARLKLATESALAYATAQKDVYRIARENSLGLIETATLYTKLAEPIRNLGGGTRETAAIVDAFAKTLKISGASTQEAAAATMQFAQAMGSGKLSGDEFRSMAETSPRFMKALAEGIGIPTGKLKEMAGQGGLTADVVGNALVGALGKLKSEAATIPATVGGAFENLKTDVLEAIDQINKSSGASLGFVEMIEEARKLIPIVSAELVAAFQSVNTFIAENRAGFAEIWRVAKGIVSDVWELAKGAASVAGFLFEWTGQTSIIKTSLEVIRMLLAGLQDGVVIIGAAFASVGSKIIEYALVPLQLVLATSAKIAGVFNEELAARIGGINQEITKFSGAGLKYGEQVFDAFGRGDSAVGRLSKSMTEVKVVKDEMYAGWLASDIEYAEKAKVVMAAYAGYSVDIQRKAMKALTDAYYGFNKLKSSTAGAGPDEKVVKAANLELAKQSRLIAELSGLTGDFSGDWDRLTKLYKTGALSVDQLTEAQAKLLAKQPAIKAAHDAEEKAAKEYAKLMREAEEEVDRFVDATDAEAAAIAFKVRTYGMVPAAVTAVQIAELEASKQSTVLTEVAIDEINRKIEALKKLGLAQGDLTRLDAEKKANEQMVKDYEATVKKYDDIFSKGFADMLNNGKDGWKSFTKSLATTFKTTVADQIYKMFAQKFVVNMVGSLTGVSGGGSGGIAQAAGLADTGGAGGIGGVVSGAKSAYGAIQNGFSGMGNVIPVVATAVASYYAAKTIADGYKVEGIGNVLNLLGAVGGAVNRLFGRRDKEYTDSTLNGNFGAGGFSGSTDQAWLQKGGVFRSDKRGVDSTALDSAAGQQLAAAYSMLKSSSAAFATTLGINADSIKDRAQSMSIALTKDAEANEKAVAEFFVNVGNQIALELAPSLGTLAKAGESASATLQRVASNYAFVDVALEAIGLKFGAVGISSVAARERLVDLTGGIEAFGRGSAFFAQTFLSEAERMKPVAESVRETMASLGLATVDTRDEFKNIVLGLDLTTEKGASTYAGLMKVQEAFAKVYPELEATGTAARSAAEILSERNELQAQLNELTMTSAQLLQKQRDGLDVGNQVLFDQIQLAEKSHAAQVAAKSSLGDVISGMRSFGNSARSLRDTLLMGSLSVLTPEQQYEEARKQLKRTEALALSGDVNAQNNWGSAQNAFLAISQKVNGGDAKYVADFKMALQTADAIAAWTDGQIDVAQASLNVLNDQVSWLATLNESVRAVEQAATAAQPKPQILVGTPDYRSIGTPEMAPLVEEIKLLRAELAGLREEQKQQTGSLIQSNDEAADRSADRVSTGFVEAAAAGSWAANNPARVNLL